MLPLMFVILTLASLNFIKTDCQQEVVPPSFKIIINQNGIKKLEDLLHKGMGAFEEKLTDTGAITFPDVSSGKYKMTDMRLSELTLERPAVQIVPGVGLKLSQEVSSSVVEGGYGIKALFFWVNGKVTMKMSMMLEVTAGTDLSAEGELTVASKACSVTFHSFDLDLHNGLYSAVASLMKGIITKQIETTICKQLVNKQFGDFNKMDKIPFTDLTEKGSAKVIFKTEKIEFYARLTKDTNLHPMPGLTKEYDREICLILSKNLVKTSGEKKMYKMEILKKARKFVPALSKENVDFKEMEHFYGICSDLDLNDITIESEEEKVINAKKWRNFIKC